MISTSRTTRCAPAAACSSSPRRTVCRASANNAAPNNKRQAWQTAIAVPAIVLGLGVQASYAGLAGLEMDKLKRDTDTAFDPMGNTFTQAEKQYNYLSMDKSMFPSDIGARLSQGKQRMDDIALSLSKKQYSSVSANIQYALNILKFDKDQLNTRMPPEAKKQYDKLAKTLYTSLKVLDKDVQSRKFEEATEKMQE